MKTAVILGGHGFIGHHLARQLKSEGYWVRTVDIKDYEYGPYDFCDEKVNGDLRELDFVEAALRLDEDRTYSYYHKPFGDHSLFDEVYQLAADMGGSGYVFTGEHDADIMHNSAQINLNVLHSLARHGFKGNVFYSSSACMYPQELQNDYHNAGLRESDAYPGNPDSEYGWEKLFSERLFMAYQRNYGLNVRIARFHNIYGPEGTYKGGREKAPAAMCRKVIEVRSKMGSVVYCINCFIEIWGTGHQTRSFLFIDDCIDAVRLLMGSDWRQPINIGSEEMVTINHLAELAIEFSGKEIKIKHIDGPTGVMGRNSNNDLIRRVLGWSPKYSLKEGLKITYEWIKQELAN